MEVGSGAVAGSWRARTTGRGVGVVTGRDRARGGAKVTTTMVVWVIVDVVGLGVEAEMVRVVRL